MAGISVYAGLQGSGKTYETVKNVILPAVASGRRVVTNVAGLQLDLIYQYCVDVLHSKKVGEIVCASSEQIVKPDFFPRMADDPLFDRYPETVVKGGDLVILDETWRWYSTGEKMPNDHMVFFRMHRHFTNDQGLTNEVVLITQDVDDLQRKVKSVVEKCVLMQKHKDLGLENRYVIHVYNTAKRNKATFSGEAQGTYEPEIYCLYKSHSQNKAAVAIETNVDTRGNVFSGALFRYGLPLAIIFFSVGVWYIWKFFHPVAAPVVPLMAGQVPGVGQSMPGVPPARGGRAGSPANDIAPDLRIVGTYVVGVDVIYLISDGGRVRKMIQPKAVKTTPYDTEILMPDGRIASRWFGSGAPVQKSPGILQ